MTDGHFLLLLLPAAIALALLLFAKAYAAFGRFRRRAAGTIAYTAVKLGLIAAVLVPVTLYAADYAWLRTRLAGNAPEAAVGSVTYFLAPQLKSGRYDIDFSQPHIQKCARSLFPHLGYVPCWTLKSNGLDIRPLSLFARPAASPPGALQLFVYYT